MRKLLSLLLVAVLLLSMPFAFAEEEEITVTVGKEWDANGKSWIEGQDHEHNYYLDYIYETTGIKIEYAWVETDDEQKIATAIATANLPDIMCVDQMQFTQLLQNDLLAPITEEFEEYATEYLKNAAEIYYAESWDAASYKGELMGIPNTLVKKEHNVVWVRKDWCDKLGIEIEWGDALTLDDIIEIACRFRDEDPDGNGENDTIGLPLEKKNLFFGYNGDFSFQPISMLFGSYPDMWYLDDDGNLTYGSVTQATRDTLEYMAQLYADKVIDPQFATISESDVVVSGKCGIFFGPWCTGPIANSYLYDGADWIPVVGPVDENGVFYTRYNQPANKYAVVAKTCEHPEALVKIIGAEFDFHRGLIDDAEWLDKLGEYQNAGISWTLMPTTVSIENGDMVGNRGRDVKYMIETGDTTGISVENVKFYEAYLKWVEDNTYSTGYIRWRGMGMCCNVAGYEKNDYKVPVFWGTTDTMSECWSALKDMASETFMNIILGEESIEAFDEFVAKWHAEGGDKIIEEIEAIIG